METESGEANGLTFSTSANGARLYCMRVQVYGAFLLVWLIKATTNGGSRTTEELKFCMSIIIGYLFIVLLVYHFFPPRKLRMRMTINGDQVSLVGLTKNITVPVASLRRIEIARSWMGRHRIFRIWDADGSIYTLASPKNGQVLESWGIEVAAGEGVQVERRVSWYLTLEPLSTFLLTLLAGSILSGLTVTNGF